MRVKIIGLAFVSLMIAGCATAPPPLPPALTYAGKNCVFQPNLATAISLTPDNNKAIWTSDQTIDAASSCLMHHSVSGPYLVYALPPIGTARMVELGSILEFSRLFSPDVVLLDADGGITRSFGADQYMYRPGVYSVQFVPQENERYALVTSNPARIGQKHDTIVGGTSSTFIFTGYGGMNWSSGSEAEMSRGFSYEGAMRAAVYRSEKD